MKHQYAAEEDVNVAAGFNFENEDNDDIYIHNRYVTRRTRRMSTRSKRRTLGTLCAGLPCYLLWFLIPLLLLLWFFLRPYGYTNPLFILPSDKTCSDIVPVDEKMISQVKYLTVMRWRIRCLYSQSKSGIHSLIFGIGSFLSSLWPEPGPAQFVPDHKVYDQNIDSKQFSSNTVDYVKMHIVSPEIRSIKLHLEEYTDRLNKLDSKFTAQLKRINSDVESNDKKIDQSIANMKDEIGILKTDLNHLKLLNLESFTTKQLDLNKQFHSEIKSYQALTIDLKQKLNDINNKLSHHDTLISVKLNELTSSGSSSNTQENTVNSLISADVVSLKNDFSEFVVNLKQYGKRQNELSDLLNDQVARNDNLKEEYVNLNKILQKMSSETVQSIAGLETKLSKIQGQILPLVDARIDTLKFELESKFFAKLKEMRQNLELTMTKTYEELLARQENLLDSKLHSVQIDDNLRERLIKTTYERVLGELKNEATLTVLIKEHVTKTFSEMYTAQSNQMESLDDIKLGALDFKIRKIVSEAIDLYSADRIGLADYALESVGASIASVRCTKTYTSGSAEFSVFGIPLFRISNSPKSLLHAGSMPGECWPFVGSSGLVIIKLAAPIYVTAVTVDHLPKSLSFDGSSSSAPKEFELYALKNEDDENGYLLSSFTYDTDKHPIQTFKINAYNRKVQFLEFKIISNHGHPDYTCVYRLRVHGKLK